MFFNNLYWWCTNQSFVQRALAAKSLKEGQKGAIYCGFLKTIGFFYLVLPALSLTTCRPFRTSWRRPVPPRSTSLIRHWFPPLSQAGHGFFAAVLFGAILSSFNSVLNSASTMFTLDLYRTAINPKASDMQCVKVGKIYGTCAGAVAICVAPFVMFAQGITTFLNSMSQFVSLPILFTVLGALIFRKAPKYAPKVITAVHVIAYGAFMILKPCYPTSGEPIHYLYAIAVLFVVEFAIMWYLNKYRGTEDYVPTDGWVVFAHQFSSIAGAGPVTGAIQAAVFGWVPVLLWILIGGIFFGAVTDFGALYASVKNDGKSMGLLIEKYIGKTGKKLFLLFCWLFTLIVIAAFADMVDGTFNAYTVTEAGVTQLSDAANVNGAAGSISLLFIVFSAVFGLIQKKANFKGWKEVVLGLVCMFAAFVIGMNFPLIASKTTWSYIVFAYIFLAAVLPIWLLMQPRDYMTTFMFAGMIIAAVVGLFAAHPTMNLPMFTGFPHEKSGDMFPILL